MLAVPVLWSQIEGAGYRMRASSPSWTRRRPEGVSYQIHQSLIAVGSGGLTGVGFGGSRQKFGFLPEPHNDFLFAMIGEEWGLIGVVFTSRSSPAFAVVGYRIARGRRTCSGTCWPSG
jgi:cell division protein FtsW